MVVAGAGTLVAVGEVVPEVAAATVAGGGGEGEAGTVTIAGGGGGLGVSCVLHDSTVNKRGALHGESACRGRCRRPWALLAKNMISRYRLHRDTESESVLVTCQHCQHASVPDFTPVQGRG